MLLAICQVNTIIDYFIYLLFHFIVCTTCTTSDHGPAGHEYAPLNDAGKSINEKNN